MSKRIQITVSSVRCPNCGAQETYINEAGEERLNIRGFKVSDEAGRWYSQCLVCAAKDGRRDDRGWLTEGWYQEP
jgi:hypothetical protein